MGKALSEGLQAWALSSGVHGQWDLWVMGSVGSRVCRHGLWAVVSLDIGVCRQ